MQLEPVLQADLAGRHHVAFDRQRRGAAVLEGTTPDSSPCRPLTTLGVEALLAHAGGVPREEVDEVAPVRHALRVAVGARFVVTVAGQEDGLGRVQAHVAGDSSPGTWFGLATDGDHLTGGSGGVVDAVLVRTGLVDGVHCHVVVVGDPVGGRLDRGVGAVPGRSEAVVGAGGLQVHVREGRHGDGHEGHERHDGEEHDQRRATLASTTSIREGAP